MKKSLFILFFITAIVAKSQIPCIVIEWNEDSTNFSVVNYYSYPSFLPVSGLSSNLEVLVKHTPFDIPDYDDRLKYLSVSHSISDTCHNIYTSNRMWLEEYTLIDRSTEEQCISVQEAENYNNYQVFPNTKHLKYIALGLAIINKKADGLTISNAEQTVLDRINAKALKIWQNYVLSQDKQDSIENGASVDLDYGWEDTDPEDEE